MTKRVVILSVSEGSLLEKNMRIAICDDESVFLSDLEQKIYKVISKLDCEVIPFSSAEELLAASVSFDLIFLDIEMGGMDGMSAARQIREKDFEIPIVFLTSHTEMAIEGYEVNAFRFLKKPVEDDKLQQTLQDIQLMKASHKGVMIKSGGEEIVVIPSEVLFLESDNNNVRIVTTSGSFTTRIKLGEAIDIFNRINDTIRKVHRCSAVNLDHVARLKDKEAILDDGSIIGISRSCFTEFKKELYDHVKKTVR